MTSSILARETQDPTEVQRYVIDYELYLDSTDSLTGLTASVTSTDDPTLSLVINSIALAPAVNGQVNQAIFFVSAGLNGCEYTATFTATTSLGETVVSLVVFNIESET